MLVDAELRFRVAAVRDQYAQIGLSLDHLDDLEVIQRVVADQVDLQDADAQLAARLDLAR